MFLGLALASCGFSRLDGLSQPQELAASALDGGRDGAGHAGGAAGSGGAAGAAGHRPSEAGTGGMLSPGEDAGGVDGTAGAPVEADGGSDGAVGDDEDASDVTDLDAKKDCVTTCGTDGYCSGVTGGCVYTSCRTLHAANPAALDGVYFLDPDGSGGQAPFSTYCSMTDAQGGGFTLILKIDGNATTFTQDSTLWTGADAYNADKPDLDQIEAKLPGYATVPFSELLVGMIDAGTARWILVPAIGSSFLGVMQQGYLATTVGRDAWKSLLLSGSLQVNCNMEGIGATSPKIQIRLGILGNNEATCVSPDSAIGFGINKSGVMLPSGNIASNGGDNGDRMTATFGYVMVR
jgi:hypothetical protein